MNLMQISIYRLYIKMQIQFEFTIILPNLLTKEMQILEINIVLNYLQYFKKRIK